MKGTSKDKGTRVLPCICKHAGQDALHGEGRRVFNHAPTNKYKDPTRWRCTICEAERHVT